MFTARVFTLYPDFFSPFLEFGIYKKALKNKLWKLETINIRDYTFDKHKSVDDTPFGGGSGMVMRADVLANALDKNILSKSEKTIYLSPKGRIFNDSCAKKFSKESFLNIICGHFEGIDQRILETRDIEEISIGDFVLSGGETASLVILDSIIRLLDGVLGSPISLNEETFQNGLLEYPQYTKPKDWEGKTVPDVLLSGDHAKIKDWRLKQSRDITRRQRPDMWKKYKKK